MTALSTEVQAPGSRPPRRSAWKRKARVAVRRAQKASNNIATMTLGRVGRILLFVGVGMVPALRSWGVISHIGFLAVWVFLFFTRELWNWHDEGKNQETTLLELARIHNSVSGSIDSVTRDLLRSDNRELGEQETKRLAAGLLHRIRDYAEYALRCPKSVGLRATLAVPEVGADNASLKTLRVWCYDQPHADRRWTRLPLPQHGEATLPGSPSAFVTRKLQIIHDIHEISGPHNFRDRKFRSVLSIPVQSGGLDGEVIAVVNIDATEPAFFDSGRVETALLPLIGPSINLLALVLLTRRQEARYEFLS